jgi:hypothetical protein
MGNGYGAGVLDGAEVAGRAAVKGDLNEAWRIG